MAVKIIDRSFIFLKKTLDEVYDALDDTRGAEIYRHDFITLSPFESYTQTTNVEVDFNVAQDYKVELIDFCQNVLKDITDNVEIYSFLHSQSGLYNAILKIQAIGENFYSPVHLKITQTTNPQNTWFSNPFCISSDIEDTTRFDYRDYGVTYGIDYLTTDIFNSIRVKGYFTKANNASQRDVYLQTGPNGRTIRKNVNLNLPQDFVIEYQDNHGLDAFAVMCAHSVIYVCKGSRTYGERATNIVDSSSEVIGASNFFKASFTANIDKTDIMQISDSGQTRPFALLQAGLQPKGTVSLISGATMSLKGFFNRDIHLGNGTLTVYSDSLPNNNQIVYTQADISLIGTNGFEILDFVGKINEIGEYFINFTPGLFLSPINQTYAVTNNTEWAFNVVGEFDYSGTDYENTQYLAG